MWLHTISPVAYGEVLLQGMTTVPGCKQVKVTSCCIGLSPGAYGEVFLQGMTTVPGCKQVKGTTCFIGLSPGEYGQVFLKGMTAVPGCKQDTGEEASHRVSRSACATGTATLLRSTESLFSWTRSSPLTRKRRRSLCNVQQVLLVC